MKYTDAQHREEAKELVRRFNDFDDLYDEAKSDIRPMMDEKEWDHFLDILGKEWKTSAKDSVAPVPIAGKHTNGCPFCKANHDPGIPCRNSQPRTGLIKPQKIERDGKLLGVNMVPVDDGLGNNRDYKTTHRRAATQLAKHFELMKKYLSEGKTREEASELAYKDLVSKKKESGKATDSIALSRGEARTLLSVIKLTR